MTAKDDRKNSQEILTLRDLLQRIDDSAADKGEVTFGTIVEAVGKRSFGPLLLLAGLVMVSPLCGVPGMPTVMALVILLIAGQLLFRRERFWLPRLVLDRSVSAGKVYRVLRIFRPVAGFVDRFLKERLTVFVDGVSGYLIAVACAVIAVAMPIMEVVPFSVHGAGVAVTAFGLALIARDGVLALFAFIVTVCTFGVAVYNMLH